MRLASCLRLLPCTAACLRSTAGPVATARPCRPTTLPLRQQHGGATHTHSLFLTCTRCLCLCSAQQKWRCSSLSPISIHLSQVQGPAPLRPERGAVGEEGHEPDRPHRIGRTERAPFRRPAWLCVSVCWSRKGGGRKNEPSCVKVKGFKSCFELAGWLIGPGVGRFALIQSTLLTRRLGNVSNRSLRSVSLSRHWLL
jgi:hypothetical protein